VEVIGRLIISAEISDGYALPQVFGIELEKNTRDIRSAVSMKMLGFT
jgi:hypothetical protein